MLARILCTLFAVKAAQNHKQRGTVGKHYLHYISSLSYRE